MAREFPDLCSISKTRHVVSRISKDGERWGLGGRKVRDGTPLSQTYKIVCVSCNNGWMGDIQEDAKPILINLIKGSWSTLGPRQRTAVANWAVSHTMIIEFADPETMSATPPERAAFKEAKIPGPDWIVCLGKYTGDNHGRSWHTARTEPLVVENIREGAPNVDRGQTTTFTVGNMMLHTARFPRGFIGDAGSYIQALGLLPVWPLNVIFFPLSVDADERRVESTQAMIWRSLGFAK